MVKIPRQGASPPQSHVDNVLTVSGSPVALFAALGNEKRLQLVALLRDAGELSITGLTAGSRVTRQAITKHLNVLEQAGLVRCTWHGRETLWHLDQRPFEEARHYLGQISNADEAVKCKSASATLAASLSKGKPP